MPRFHALFPPVRPYATFDAAPLSAIPITFYQPFARESFPFPKPRVGKGEPGICRMSGYSNERAQSRRRKSMQLRDAPATYLRGPLRTAQQRASHGDEIKVSTLY